MEPLDPALYSIDTVDDEMKILIQKRQVVQEALAYQCSYFSIQIARIRSAIASDSTNIGVIGCGFIGSAIISTLLDTGFHSHQIKFSTRSPNSLNAVDFDPRTVGVQRCADLIALVESSDIIILAVPVSQLQAVGRLVRTANTTQRVLISTLVGISAAKIGKVCNFNHVLKTYAEATMKTNVNDFTLAAMEYSCLSSRIRDLSRTLKKLSVEIGTLEPENATALVEWAVLGKVKPSWVTTTTSHEWEYISRLVQVVFTKECSNL